MMSRAAASRRDGGGGTELKRVQQKKDTTSATFFHTTVLQPHYYTHALVSRRVVPHVFESRADTHACVYSIGFATCIAPHHTPCA